MKKIYHEKYDEILSRIEGELKKIFGKERGWQVKFAEDFNKSEQYVNAMLKGRTKLGVGQLVELCARYGFNMNYIVYGERGKTLNDVEKDELIKLLNKYEVETVEQLIGILRKSKMFDYLSDDPDFKSNFSRVAEEIKKYITNKKRG